jgi:PadR family transcriptional regulator PadR
LDLLDRICLGTSENNRKARYYSVTRLGKKQLEVETENWERFSGVVGRVLSQEAQV